MTRRGPLSPLIAALLVASAFTGIGCGEVCQTGEACRRSCPEGGVALCAAHGLCACLREPDTGPLDGIERFDSGADRDGGAAGVEAMPAPADGCRAPSPGEIVINEVMLDGEPTEDAEFVELANTTSEALALGGVVLTSNRGDDQVRRVEFSAGCLPPTAAVALFARRADWIESTPSAPPISAELRSFGFANGGDFDFRLMLGELTLDRMSGLGDAIEPGVSLNRSPDRQGPPHPHHVVDPGGSPASPGRCPGGGRYEDGCAPPADRSPDAPDADPSDGGLPDVDASVDPGEADIGPDFACPPPEPGDLRINEVLIDGITPRTEADEFVEIVNRTASARRLRQVSVAVEIDEGSTEDRVRFADGCLPAGGAMVLHPDRADWRFVPPPPTPPLVDEARLTLGNESRHPLLLSGPAGVILDRFDPGDADVVEGVSLNRSPDVHGEAWRLHDRLAPTPSSPGSCADGTPFSPDGCPEGPDAMPQAACAEPEDGAVIINEVLIDGEAPGETDEFIELVNTGPSPVAMADLRVSSSQTDGDLIERIVFERGCLPPGALAVFGDRGAWLGAEQGLVARVERLALPNETPVVIELSGPTWRRTVELIPGNSEAGVSLVRATDGDPTAPWVRHDTVSPLPASPGAGHDGAPVEIAGDPP